MKTLAYHNDQAVKTKYVARMRHHIELDKLVQGFGSYWSDDEQRGCFVGCTVYSDSHQDMEYALGVDEQIIRIAEGVFENCPSEWSHVFAQSFFDVIAVGADLSMIIPKFLHWLLSDPKHGVIRHADEGTRTAIEGVIVLFARHLNGEEVTEEDWDAAWDATRDAAKEAAKDAAWDATRAAARAAAWCAAKDAAWDFTKAAAWDAAWSAAWAAAKEAARDSTKAAAGDAAWSAAWKRSGEKLIELLASAPADTVTNT